MKFIKYFLSLVIFVSLMCLTFPYWKQTGVVPEWFGVMTTFINGVFVFILIMYIIKKFMDWFDSRIKDK